AGTNLGLVRRHVDVDGTITLAALTAQAEIERFLHLFALPAVRDRPAVQHFKQQPRATARAVLLFPGCHVARAHHTLTAVVAATGSDAHTAAGRPGEAAAILLVREAALDLRRPVERSDAQIGRNREGIDHLPGVHLPLRIPD